MINELEAKRLELLHQLVPGAVRIAVLVNPANVSYTEATLREVEAAARTIGVQVQVLNANTAREIEQVSATIGQERPDALFVGASPFLNIRRVGAKPADLPVMQASKVRVRHQLATARLLGLESAANAARPRRRGDRMRRRAFISLLGGAGRLGRSRHTRSRRESCRASVFRLELCRMEPLGLCSHAPAARARLYRELHRRDRDRWTEGRNERYAAMAAELVGLKVNIIVALGTPAIVAARKATSVISIVFPLASDPVGDGLVASLARPGGNVTGPSN